MHFSLIEDVENCFNPLHPNISIHILYTLFHTFPLVQAKESSLFNQSILGFVIISFILMISMTDSAVFL